MTTGPLPPPLPHRSRYGPELRRLCQELLQRDPSRRPSAKQSLREPVVQQRLLSLLNEEPTNIPEQPAQLANVTTECFGIAPRFGPQRKSESRTLLPFSPVATPRALRSVGELCSQTNSGVLAGPRATLRRRVPSTITNVLQPSPTPVMQYSLDDTSSSRPATGLSTGVVLDAAMLDEVVPFRAHVSEAVAQVTVASILDGAFSTFHGHPLQNDIDSG